MSISRELAKDTLTVNFEDLPKEVVHQVKRHLIDTLGCAVGGYPSDASQILQEVVKELDGPAEATVIGSGIRTSCLNATLVNGAMVRYLDFNDTSGGGHNSEVMPALLAVGEKVHATGKDVVAPIVLGYELAKRFMDGIMGRGMHERGFNMDSRGAYVMPLVVGKLLGLNEEQLVNAVGISGSHNLVLGVLDATGEEYTMSKNLRFPFTAYGGLWGALLARRGFTGPARVIEGEEGFVQAVLQGDYDVAKVLAKRDGFAIMDAHMKSLPTSHGQHGYLTAVLTLTKEHDIKPEEVASIKLVACPATVWHVGNPVKRFPTNAETANHSAYFLAAVAVVDRQLGPEQFSLAKYKEPRVLALIDKVTIESRPELRPELRPEHFAGIAELTTKQGATYTMRVDDPLGHRLNPMSDRQVEEKFRSMAAKFMGEDQIQSVFAAAWDLENLDDIGKLMQLMVFR